MNAINRADEASLRKQYEEGEVTSLVETYRQNATDATLAKDESDTRIAHLVTDPSILLGKIQHILIHLFLHYQHE